MANINLKKISYIKTQFENTVDTNFTELANTSPVEPAQTPQVSVDQFFQEYNDIFFQIPKFGETNSHEYLVKTSGAYIESTSTNNSTIQALIEEVNTLRQQNLELQRSQIQSTLATAQQALQNISNG